MFLLLGIFVWSQSDNNPYEEVKKKVAITLRKVQPNLTISPNLHILLQSWLHTNMKSLSLICCSFQATQFIELVLSCR